MRPSWKFCQMTNTWPVASVHLGTTGAPIPLSSYAVSTSNALMFVDASPFDTFLHSSLLCPIMPSKPITCSYMEGRKRRPSTQAELLQCLMHWYIHLQFPPRLLLSGLSTLILQLLSVSSTALAFNALVLEIQGVLNAYPCPLLVQWCQHNSHPRMQAAGSLEGCPER